MTSHSLTRRSRQHLALLLCIAIGLAACSASPDPARAATGTERTERTEAERDVLAAVQSFFTTMNGRDSAGTRRVLDSTGDFVSVRTDENGQQVVRRAANSDYLNRVATLPQTYLERMWDADVRVHGPIATVWTPYDFYIDGTFSHCGVDIFHLVKTDAGWKITSGTYTVERTGCPDSPLGPP